MPVPAASRDAPRPAPAPAASSTVRITCPEVGEGGGGAITVSGGSTLAEMRSAILEVFDDDQLPVGVKITAYYQPLYGTG